MDWEFEGEIIEWRGPAPFLFVPVPDEISQDIKAVSNRVTYGWGVIPVKAKIGNTAFTTSLFPRKGIYLVPVKVVVQKAEGVEEGSLVKVSLEIVISQS